MTRAGILVLVLVLAASAHASPNPLVVPPADWRQDPEASSALSIKVANARAFGDIAASAAAQVYVPPRPGVALSVTRTSAETGPAHGAAARAALDAFHAVTSRGELTGTKLEILAREDGIEQAQHVATVTWKDPAAQVTTAGRLVLAANAAGLVAASGECVWTADAAPALVEACTRALASVDTGIPVADRVAIVLAAAPPAPPAASATSSGMHRPPEAPRLDDSERLRMTPISIPQRARETDRRPVYVGAGIVVLAAIFWWNRRRRDEIDRARATEEGRPAAAERASDDDADADDLRAAARGDGDRDG